MTPFLKKKSPDISRLLQVFKGKKRYHTIQKIGEGGISVVSSSFDRFLNRVVVTKELKEERCDNPSLLRAFITEAKLISYLDHPGIVPIFDTYSPEDDKLCYTMKLVEGMRLSSLLGYRAKSKDGYGVSVNQFLEIFRKMCETLSYAHDRGVIHLDIKPDNIIIGKYGEVTIMDWGNARLYNPKPYYDYFSQHLDDASVSQFDKESQNLILGTPDYMSPEQTSTPRDKLGPGSDIFSAGIILYQMLCGKHPFSHVDKTAEIMREIRSYEPEPIHKINSDIPVRLSMICQNMLQKDLTVRYKSFKDILEDISEFCNSGQAFSTRTYKPGEILFREGDAGEFAFEILQGAIEVIKNVEGKEKVLARLKKGEIVGELAIFADQPRTATVRAVEPTVIRIMDKASVEKELDKLSPWVGKMITSLSNRFIEMNEKLAQIQK